MKTEAFFISKQVKIRQDPKTTKKDKVLMYNFCNSYQFVLSSPQPVKIWIEGMGLRQGGAMDLTGLGEILLMPSLFGEILLIPSRFGDFRCDCESPVAYK